MHTFTLSNENKLQMSENKLLGKIHGLMNHEVSGQFMVLHIEELCDLY
jgi:hypothetical protein